MVGFFTEGFEQTLDFCRFHIIAVLGDVLVLGKDWFQSLMGFFDLFFLEEGIKGICHFYLIVLIALTLGQLALS